MRIIDVLIDCIATGRKIVGGIHWNAGFVQDGTIRQLLCLIGAGNPIDV